MKTTGNPRYPANVTLAKIPATRAMRYPALAVLGLALAAPAGAALLSYQVAVLDQDPYSFHRFNESSGPTAADLSGNDRDGTYAGSPTFGISGIGGVGTDNAVGLDGSNDYMTISDSAGLGQSLANVTFESIFRTTNTSNANLFGTWNTGTNMAVNFEFHRSDDLHRFFLRNNSGHTLIGEFTNSDVSNGDFQHLMLAVDMSQDREDRIRIYLNGQAHSVTVSSQTSIWLGDDMDNLNLGDFAFPLAVGARNLRGNLDRHFDGVIDEFVIYDKTLTAADAAAHWAAAIPEPSTATLLALGAFAMLRRRRS